MELLRAYAGYFQRPGIPPIFTQKQIHFVDTKKRKKGKKMFHVLAGSNRNIVRTSVGGDKKTGMSKDALIS